MTPRERALTLRKRLAYSAPAFFFAVVGVPLYIYIPKFYTDVVGVNPTVLGFLILGVRLFDGVTDPLAGAISDKSRSRWGRRRPFIAIASVFLALFLYALYVPPEMDPTIAPWWFGVSIFAVALFWTLAAVPWESMGPEMTFDYDERTSLMGLRDGFLLAGTLAAAASPLIIDSLLGLPDTPDGRRTRFFWFAVVYGPLLVAACWWCVSENTEPTRPPKQSSTGSLRAKILESLRLMGRNRPFLLLLASFTVGSIGANLPAALILYYVEYLLQAGSPELFLLMYLVTGIVLLPAWVLLAKRWGKKWAYLAAMAINTGAFIGVFFLGAGDVWLYGVLTCLSGTGFGATVALPSSMQADVIDYDEYLTGRRREGQFIGIWAIAKKLASAAGIGLALPILDWAGYAPEAQQPEQVLLTLRVLYALAPCICNVAAIALLLTYPLDKSAHQRVLAAVDEAKQGRNAEDPLASS